MKKTHAERLQAWFADIARRAGMMPKSRHYGQNKIVPFMRWLSDMSNTREGCKHAATIFGKLYGRSKTYKPSYARECARRLRQAG